MEVTGWLVKGVTLGSATLGSVEPDVGGSGIKCPLSEDMTVEHPSMTVVIPYGSGFGYLLSSSPRCSTSLCSVGCCTTDKNAKSPSIKNRTCLVPEMMASVRDYWIDGTLQSQSLIKWVLRMGR